MGEAAGVVADGATPAERLSETTGATDQVILFDDGATTQPPGYAGDTPGGPPPTGNEATTEGPPGWFDTGTTRNGPGPPGGAATTGYRLLPALVVGFWPSRYKPRPLYGSGRRR